MALSANPNPRLLLLAALVCAGLALAADKPEYKTGTLISWGAGGENCAGLGIGKSVTLGKVNCNPGGDTLYKVASEGHQYILTRGADNETK